MIAFGTVAGGVGAALTGGNFWQGAASGFIVSALNHTMHEMMKPKISSMFEDDDIDPPSKNKLQTKTQNQSNESNFKSGSAVVGYEGMVLNKSEILIKYGAKGENFSNMRQVAKTLKLTSLGGKGLGVAGMALTTYEDYSSNNLSWGTAAKVGIGGVLLFTSAPVSLTYAILDIGVGYYTGTTITDRVGNYVNDKVK